MTVLTSSKRTHAKSRRRRFSAAAGPAAAAPAPAPPAPPAPLPRRRRELGPQADRALYTCSCGFVFHAAVSTSVGCPHCGGTQAW
jgi:hypothetical protein